MEPMSHRTTPLHVAGGRRWLERAAITIRTQHPVIFFGAGISRGSGLPIVADLKNGILRGLCATSADRRAIADSPLPFEAFMEGIGAQTDIDALIAIFDLGVPSTTHEFMARLAGADSVNTFITTNFDRLLERALRLDGTDFAVRATNQQLDSWRSGSRRVTVLKLHGTVERKKSIRTTLSAVASRQLSDGRRKVVKRVFARDVPIIVLGYSGSDAFDISPIIKAVRNGKATVLYVDHATGQSVRVTKLSELPTANPFRGLAGVRLHGDTNILVRTLWKRLRHVVGDYHPSTSSVDWQECVKRWLAHVPKGVDDLIIATLLFQISHARRTIHYCRSALRRLPRRSSATRAACWILLGQAHHALGAYVESIKCCRVALRLIGRSDHSTRASIHEKLGGAAHNLGHYALARFHYERALKLATHDRRRQSLCHSGLGSVAYRLRDFRTAIAHYRKAIALAQRIGFKVGEAAYLLNAANVYAAQQSYARARKAYAAASEAAELTGYAAGEITARVALGDLNLSLRRYDDAWDMYTGALAQARKLRYVIRIVNCLIGLGQISLARNDFVAALRNLKAARLIARKHTKRAEEAEACEAIGNVYRAAARIELTIRYYSAAAEIYRMTRQYTNLVTALGVLVTCHSQVGNARSAIRAQLEQESVRRKSLS
jgi:tetratricopeptide (TPR) repeat protein